MDFFWVSNPTLIFFEIDRNYVSIIITIISNITVLVPHTVICFGHFMPMSHGVSKKVPPIVSPLSLPRTRFSLGVFVVLQAILYQPFFALIRLLQKMMYFQSEKFFSCNVLLVGFNFAVLCICVC